MKAKALMNALADKLGKVQAEKPGDTLANVKGEELVHALTDTVAEETVLIQKKKQDDMNAKTLVDASGDTLRKEKTKTKDEKL